MNGIHEVRGSIPLSSTTIFGQVREVCKAMRLTSLRSSLLAALILLSVGAFAGCENPFDPLGSSKSDKIQGLTYIDFSATWDRWDSDPQYDGMTIKVDYFNEYGDSLAFHDKSHNVTIEFWTQKPDEQKCSQGITYFIKEKLIFSTTVRHSNSDDPIRIPVESYSQNLVDPPEEFTCPPTEPTTPTTPTEPIPTPDPTSVEATGFIVVRVFPPQNSPKSELVLAQPDQTYYKPEVGTDAVNQ